MKPLSRNPVTWLVLAAALAVMAGCGSAPTLSEPGANAHTMRYLIGAGDTLEIYVRNNPKLSVTVPVRPDGRISIPLVQSIMAAGKTPDQLASALEDALKTYVRTPMVTVIVKNFVGSYSQQIRVVGQAAKPMALHYRRGMTLLDVMIDVGGLTKFAAGNNAKIVRRMPDGKKQTIDVDLGDLMDGDISDNVAMRPGDILIIPQSVF